MLDEIGTGERLYEWLAFMELDPIGPQRLERSLGQILQLLANRWRASGQPMLNLDDVLLRFGDDAPPPPRKQTWQDQYAIGQMMSAITWADDPPKSLPGA
jgi:hypothetical protein